MSVKKIDLMHKLYGIGNGQCKDCNHFKEYKYNMKKYFKCGIYGESNSESTDWRKKYDACGMMNKKVDISKINPIVNLVSKSKQITETQCVGQIRLF